MQVEPNFFSDRQVIDNPRNYFDLMRSKGRVVHEYHHGTLMVTGHAEAVEVLSNRSEAFSNACSVIGPIPSLPFSVEGSDIAAQLDAHRSQLPWSDHLVCFDGQKHAEHRALLGGLLTYRRLKENEGYLRRLADRLLDGIVGTGVCDLVPAFAHATTVYAISDLMGIPVEDRAELLTMIGAPPSQVEGDAMHKVGPDPLVFLKPRFDQYLRDRRQNPQDDLLSELANATFRDGSPPDFDTLSGLARFLFGAAQDTTSRLIAMTTLILAEDPALQDRVRREPGRVGDLIEEVLRFDAPVKAVYRLALTDTTVAGRQVPAGTIVTVCLSAANNDPSHFAEPDRFDIDRPNKRDHLGFSRGAHGCLGAPLGRMEARITIQQLLARTSNIAISEDHHGMPADRTYRFEPTYSFRNLADLHVDLKV